MRLTLRTLLAYLDDILEPSHAREIGAKVNESGYASMLVNRIREVMRRRRLSAPELSGPGMGLDPNNVAEYLDNTLGPDAVADVEKICLDSDVHLAEVAASHQILTLVLGEPVDVPASTRERMYALGPRVSSGSNGRKAAEAKSEAELKTVTGSSNQAAPEKKPSDDTAFDGTIPDYLKPAPLWKRVGPIAVAVLVGVVWLWLVYFDPSLNNPGDGVVAALDGSATTDATTGPNGDASPATNPVGTSQPPPSETGTEPGSAEQGTSPTESVAAAGNPARPFADLPNHDPAVPPDSPTSSQPEKSLPVTTTPQTKPETAVAAVGTTPAAEPTTVPATTTSPATSPGTAPPDPAVTEVPVTVPAPEMIYVSREGILARKTSKGWMVMPGRTAIRAGDHIASPAPYTALFQITSLYLTIELHPGAAVEYLGATADVQAAFRIHQGQVALKREAPPEITTPLNLGIQLFGEDCQLALTTPRVQCGLEMTPREPTRYKEDLSADPYVGALFVISGEAAFHGRQAQGKLAKPETVSAPGWMPLGVKDRKAIAVAGSRPPLPKTPNWLDPDQSGMSTTVRRYAVRFEKEIDPDLPLEHTMPTIVRSPVPRLAEYAAATLQVTGQIPGLIEAMARGEFEEVRDTAITGLRQWLPQSNENRETLKAELEKHFPPDQVDPIYRLLWGYDDTDARNQVTSRLLVDWLKNDSIVIRQLAFMHIYRLTGQRYDYRPVNPPNQRKVAVERWEQHLKKNDDLLVK